MFRISRATPAFYLTSVTHNRLPIFRKDTLKQVLCNAWAEARERHGILVLAYVVMDDHVHLLAAADRDMADTLRLLNGIAARRIVQYLKKNGFEQSLFKLRGEMRERNHQHSVWQHHADSLEIFGEATFRQKLDYIHMNPVRGQIVLNPFEYRFSSARQWAGIPLDGEPLETDHSQIQWW